MSSYTAAEARARLSEVLDEAQSGPVEITRRGKPAAVLLSQEEYRRLSGKPGLMDAIQACRVRHADTLAEMTNADFPAPPKRSPSRDIDPWR